jgi:hypothetical protein
MDLCNARLGLDLDVSVTGASTGSTYLVYLVEASYGL